MKRSTLSPAARRRFFKNVHGVRYHVKDVTRAVEFYTGQLGFELEHQHLPEFARVSLGGVALFLSGPGASGSRALPGGENQEPGGSNRVVLHTIDRPACVAALKQAGIRFRNEIETGRAGRQVQIGDPGGNPIELFEPATSSPQSVRFTCVARRFCGAL